MNHRTQHHGLHSKPGHSQSPRRRTNLWVRAGIIAMAVVVILGIVGGGTGWYFAFHNRGMNYHLDAKRIAASETRMWQAYYTGNNERLGLELVAILREQFGLSYVTAGLAGEDLAKAAIRFAKARENYERDVLPLLETAYERIRAATDGNWDSKAVARAELDWWVLRRTPDGSPENVGRLIAQEYALLYGRSNPDLERAGQLRAQAADLRDQGGQNADWPRIQGMLEESYAALVRGVM